MDTNEKIAIHVTIAEQPPDTYENKIILEDITLCSVEEE